MTSFHPDPKLIRVGVVELHQLFYDPLPIGEESLAFLSLASGDRVVGQLLIRDRTTPRIKIKLQQTAT
jgi:hypothetical protein